MPQAAWFFFGSPPNDLPLAHHGVGRGWFASTINARSLKAIMLIPAAPIVLLLNQFRPLRNRIWPHIQERLGITFRPLQVEMTEWHTYCVHWDKTGCTFLVDEHEVLRTEAAPGGPLGFVCWLDNQYMILTKRGRFGWGTKPTNQEQILHITDLEIGPS